EAHRPARLDTQHVIIARALDELIDELALPGRVAGDVGGPKAVIVPAGDLQILTIAELPAELERGPEPAAAECIEGPQALKRILVMGRAREPARQFTVFPVAVGGRLDPNPRIELPGEFGQPAVDLL